MKLLVYKASAGSGKTFTLTVEYIAKLIYNPRSYRHILAVTFTNKATTEMKERILSQLYGIWQKETESEAYLKEIKKRVALSDEEIRVRAGEALFNIIHDYNYFRVETIDSFFQSVMRNLARELGLNLNLNVELNNDEVLSESVDSLIENLTPTSQVLFWLLEYIEEKIQDERNWNVANEIKSFGRNIFDEKYIEKGKDLRRNMKNPHYISTYKKEIQAIQKEALEQMKGFYDQFHSLLSEKGLTVDDLAYKSTGVASYFNKLNEGYLRDDAFNARAQKSHDDAEAWCSKSSPQKELIISLASSELQPLLQTAEKYRKNNNKIVQSCFLSLA
ncbi:MAG: UvrD-helicase domain-containing protein, partial [Clostridiales bacterium]|nr:UvrD-helicase domain-containing protein [Clostridiales bacterium]